jgi:hypothetical protein
MNLAAKLLFKQFNVKKKKGGGNGLLDKPVCDNTELLNLAGDIERKEEETQVNLDLDKESEGDDKMDGYVNKMEELTEEEQKTLMEEIKPVWLMLLKVSFRLPSFPSPPPPYPPLMLSSLTTCAPATEARLQCW